MLHDNTARALGYEALPTRQTTHCRGINFEKMRNAGLDEGGLAAYVVLGATEECHGIQLVIECHEDYLGNGRHDVGDPRIQLRVVDDASHTMDWSPAEARAVGTLFLAAADAAQHLRRRIGTLDTPEPPF